MLASLNVLINYGQLILYLPSVDRPGHLWGEPEMQQGFAWSPGIVSFGVPEHAFICTVEIEMVDAFRTSPDAISCLRVPFDVSETPVQIGSIFEYEPVDIPTGAYSLMCEVLPGRGTWEIDTDDQKEIGDIDHVIKISLARGDSDIFEVLKTGGAVFSDKVLSRLCALA